MENKTNVFTDLKGLKGTALLLSAKCPFCKKTNFVILYHFPDKNPYEAEQLIPEKNIALPLIRCCNHEKLVTHMHIVVDGEIESTSQLGGDTLPVVHRRPGRGTVTPEEQDIEDCALREYLQTDSIKIDKFYRNYFKYLHDDPKRWRMFLYELSKEEYLKGYQAAGWLFDTQYSLKMFRADMRRRKDIPPDELFKFFCATSEDLIEGHFLYLYPQSWSKTIKQWINMYGQIRCAYPVLYLPLPEELELYRMEAVIAFEKATGGIKDSSIAFERLIEMQKELSRYRKRVADLYALLQQERDVVAELQAKLYDVRQKLQDTENKRVICKRDPRDINKIRELKSFVTELKDELSKYLPQQEVVGAVALDDALQPLPVVEGSDLSVLGGKVIGIIGGRRQEQAERGCYPCVVLTDSAEKMGPEFYQVLKDSDILIVLTEHVSHVAMWEARAHAVSEGKPIYFRRGLNIWQLLSSIVDGENN